MELLAGRRRTLVVLAVVAVAVAALVAGVALFGGSAQRAGPSEVAEIAVSRPSGKTARAPPPPVPRRGSQRVRAGDVLGNQCRVRRDARRRRARWLLRRVAPRDSGTDVGLPGLDGHQPHDRRAGMGSTRPRRRGRGGDTTSSWSCRSGTRPETATTGTGRTARGTGAATGPRTPVPDPSTPRSPTGTGSTRS